MSKTLIFCADGTWNSPNQAENTDHTADPTNVFKLFTWLAGADSADSIRNADEQERRLVSQGAPVQIAKYIHGVGDSRNPIVKLMGGTLGSGVISRVVRGYTFLARNYLPGDRIVIVGFSRGAYTARALAGLILSQGLLDPRYSDDPIKAYRLGAEAWYRYRRATLRKQPSLAHLGEVMADLPAFILSGTLSDSDLVPVDQIEAVAVWDTVGALGIPDYVGDGERVDAFKFVDTMLSARVKQGFQALARDERRADFTPTLWTAAANVIQVVFPGAHADVGGGYPMGNHESGLSDGALKWMVERLGSVGVAFAGAPSYALQANVGGVAHKPWAHSPWSLIKGLRLRQRTFPADVAEHESIAARLAAGSGAGRSGRSAGAVCLSARLTSRRLAGWRGRLPAESPRCPPASSASCLPSASPAVSSCE
jgi:uncharacterized protein (DUF2235 family)